MYKIIAFFTLLVFLISGCSVHKNRYDKKRNELENSITSTQKARVVFEDNSTALVIATYLNNLEEYEKSKVDVIALSVFFSEFEKNKDAYDIPKVWINDEETSIIKLKQDDEVIKHLPTTNSWSSYYLIMGKKDVDLEKLKLTVEIYPSVQVLLMLQKDF